MVKAKAQPVQQQEPVLQFALPVSVAQHLITVLSKLGNETDTYGIMKAIQAQGQQQLDQLAAAERRAAEQAEQEAAEPTNRQQRRAAERKAGAKPAPKPAAKAAPAAKKAPPKGVIDKSPANN